ncbi:hypothetical protein R4282_18840 [Rhodococcus oxybenzonivorans]|uniref:hypothetical protein n=1 Tax=Rhodococcus oxybenzonivorans TaxID=1990687 RepID=UPI002955A1C2|nr:hypothetical protein [Rhodococcus oxybenzonivorans]MDV7355055.1 hypothetical protein [Rhodococcus oxybenzonivorans]
MNRQPIPGRQIDVAEKQSTPRNLLRTRVLFSPLDALSRALPPDREETVVLIPSSPVLTRHGTHPKTGAPANFARRLGDPRIVRGAGCAAVMVSVRVLIGSLLDTWPQHGAWFRGAGAVVVVGAAAAWGAWDRKRADRAPDADPTLRWLAAAVVAGVAAGAAAWLLARGGVPVYRINSLPFELTAGAAWTLLLVFVAAVAGLRGAAGKKRRAR